MEDANKTRQAPMATGNDIWERSQAKWHNSTDVRMARKSTDHRSPLNSRIKASPQRLEKFIVDEDSNLLQKASTLQ